MGRVFKAAAIQRVSELFPENGLSYRERPSNLHGLCATYALNAPGLDNIVPPESGP
jgi:hypothetical protein